jgi:uncharacterized delta-60 repeat protein
MRLMTFSSVLFGVAACGDDNPSMPDAAITPDMTDAAIDAPSFVAPTPFKIDISAGGPDQVMAAAAGPSGSFYIAGWTADSPTGTRYVFVAKLTGTGALDTTFGTGGVFTSDVVFRGGTDEIDMVVQSSGNIIVAATIANDVNANDRDIGLIRVTAAGALDTDFGVVGFSRINLSTAHDNNGTLSALDAQRGLALGPSDALFIHAQSRNDVDMAGARTDADFTVAKLSANGLLDVNYGTAGKYLLDFSGINAGASSTARGIRALADGSVIASGYQNSPGIGSVQPVLYRLTPAGVLDASFDVFHDVVLAAVTEIYDISVDGDRITTAGYGRTIADAAANDWVSLRFDTATGARSTTFGTSNGALVLDVSGTMAGDNCRTAIGLPGGKTAVVGSTGAAPDRDAALAILTQSGQLDTSYGTGLHKFEMDGDDQWWAGARNGDVLLVAGWRGQATQTATDNDDSYGILLPLE